MLSKRHNFTDFEQKRTQKTIDFTIFFRHLLIFVLLFELPTHALFILIVLLNHHDSDQFTNYNPHPLDFSTPVSFDTFHCFFSFELPTHALCILIVLMGQHRVFQYFAPTKEIVTCNSEEDSIFSLQHTYINFIQ